MCEGSVPHECQMRGLVFPDYQFIHTLTSISNHNVACDMVEGVVWPLL